VCVCVCVEENEKKINACDFLNFELCLFGLERNREGGQICLLCVCVCVLKRMKKISACDFSNLFFYFLNSVGLERNGEGERETADRNVG
jgi:hypothetical protein